MNTIYLDQLTTLVPKAEGVEEAMSASAGMNTDSIQSMAEDTRSRLNKLFHGPGPESVVFTPGVEAGHSDPEPFQGRRSCADFINGK